MGATYGEPMHYTIWGWTGEPPDTLHYVRARCLTEELDAEPVLESVVRRGIEEYMINDFSVEADPGSFTRRDLAGDESVPEEEWPYTWLEMHS